MAHTALRSEPRAFVHRQAATGVKSATRYRLRKLPAKTWDYRTSRFQCPGCHAVYIVGLAFWGVAEGRTRRVPPDTIPTPEQSRELARLDEEWAEGTGRKGSMARRLARTRVAEGHHSAYFGEKQWGESVNVVIEEGADEREE